jgi:gamma-glutamyltranspeptidase / glutathione hydrolase
MKRLTLLALAFTIVATSLHAAAREPVRARHGMVASTSEIASRVGVEVMRKGGNAVDAAVAVGLALGVTWPAAGNIGGGGFMLIRKADGTAEVIDYRGTSPAAATRGMFLDSDGNVIKGLSTYGHKASAVPGTVAGLRMAHERHGKLPWADLVEPARKLAVEGFVVSDFLAWSFLRKPDTERLERFPESRRIFLRNGKYFSAGERLVQPELAATLARIQRNPREFYEGETARLTIAEMARHGGVLTLEDFRSYRPIVRQPVRGTYRGIELLTLPPPSSGGTTLLEALNILEAYDLRAMGWHSAQYVHTVVEALRRAFADRAVHVADPAFADVPVAELTSKEYAVSRRRTIDPNRASSSREIAAGEPLRELQETAHFSIVDAEENLVSNTYTINNWFGSGVTVPGAGFLLNDDMDDFTVKPGVPNEFGLIQGEANEIAGNKRPLSSMNPVIALMDGKPWLAVGSPGGPRIITTVLHVILNVVDFEMNIAQAIEAPRFHHQWMPDEIYWEDFGVNPDTRAILERMGHRFRRRSESPLGIGEADAVMIDPTTRVRLGAADSRRDGAAAGY